MVLQICLFVNLKIKNTLNYQTKTAMSLLFPDHLAQNPNTSNLTLIKNSSWAFSKTSFFYFCYVILYTSLYFSKFIGYICIRLTFPTGKDIFSCFNATPRSEPAHATCNSGRFSQKYFNDVIALRQSCISSRINKVFPGMICFFQRIQAR